MDINIGSRVKYTFPNQLNESNGFATGIVESINESFIVMLTAENVRIKINFKNFENIELLTEANELNLHKAV